MRLLLRKAPKIFSYVLWVVVFAKLICPVTFESVISLIPEQLSTQRIENVIVLSDTDNGLVENKVKLDLSGVDKAKDIQIEAHTNKKPSVIFYLAVIWLMGIMFMFVYSSIGYIKLKKRLVDAIHLKDNLYESSRVPSPFVMGILNPNIYLPKDLEKIEAKYIIKHEQVHIERKDYLIKLIAFSISCIHWFNPLVWLSFLLLNRDMEMSCDERVIKNLGDGIKRQYSNSLLSMAADIKMPSSMPIAFRERGVKERIRNVLNYRRPALWIILVSAILVATVCIGLFFSPSVSQDNWRDKKQPIQLKDYVISDSQVTLFDGTAASIKLLMTDGNYYDEEYAGAGGGTYAENYDGNYELQLVDQKGSILFSIDLNSDWDCPNINYSGTFDILYTDYNGDNCPDFTIGTYGSSNMNLYYIYTITKDNEIKRICQTEIAYSIKKWSVVFEHEAEGEEYRFFTEVYNNAVGETQQYTYQWYEDTGYFKVNKPEESDNKDYLISLFGEPHNYYFKSEYSDQDYDGDGIVDKAQINSSYDNTNSITVSFGNGDTINLTVAETSIHNFKILGVDLNENGENEIIILSDSGAQGGDGVYVLSVYEKQGNSYKLIPLPKEYSIYNGFTYILKWDGHIARIFDGYNKELMMLNYSNLAEHYKRINASAEWDRIQENSSDKVYADGVCDAVINAESDKPTLMLKQYLVGPTGVHVDCIGYMVTELQLNTDNSWKLQNIYYLPSD
jgi:beta-lactamase regulating signal transducer with metallopeptidase domain